MNHSIRVSLDAWLPTEIHDEQLIRLTAARKKGLKVIPSNLYIQPVPGQMLTVQSLLEHRSQRHVTRAQHVHKATLRAVEAFKVPLAARYRGSEKGGRTGWVRARGNATPNAEFKIRPVCTTGRKSLGEWCKRSAVFPVQRTSQIYKHIEIFCRVSQSANNAGRTGGFIPIRIQDVGNSTIFRRYILKDLETERRKGIFAMRTEFDRYLLIVDLLLEVEPRFDKWQIDRNIVKKAQKYFARSFLGRRKILNARRYMVVYMNACI
ncbi:hypothetical protein G5I_08991 [Acromyrmex echinatior]|uniref:Uncharacterized protein n=1 Tax=Acromyrmex echinatior TaxID=103372 RepID=F4WT17_ACREC|nr:hypothetical protein G5I_08991 [Acromyrmex echinatior]